MKFGNGLLQMESEDMLQVRFLVLIQEDIMVY